MRVIGNIAQDNKTHSYCPKCWSECTFPFNKEGREYYKCNNCGYEDSRLIIFYPQLRFALMEDHELLHYSVGSIVMWNEKYLLFHRRLFPFQYTIIAGHWDLSDITPEHAMSRELEEECGIKKKLLKPLFVETLKEPCRRGADFHKWYLYKVNVKTHLVKLSNEADIIGWYSASEIKGLDLTIPTGYFLKKLKII